MSDKRFIILLAVVVPCVIVAAAGLIIWVTMQHDARLYAEKHQGCMPGAPNHMVIVQNDTPSPAHTDGKRCDTLTINNLDDVRRLIAFGLHEEHVPYDGVLEHTLLKGQSLTVTMVQTGDFRFHDHIHDKMQATFTVY